MLDEEIQRQRETGGRRETADTQLGLREFVLGAENTPETSNTNRRTTAPYRSGSVRLGAEVTPTLTKTPLTGTSELKINHLKDFMVGIGGRGSGSQPKNKFQPLPTNLFDQNQSNFKPISIDQGVKPVAPIPKEGGFRAVPATVTFRTDSINPFAYPTGLDPHKIQAFDRHLSAPGSARMTPAPQPVPTTNHRTTTDSKGFGVFDEQVSMALRSAERRPTPNLPTQTDLTEEDRIDEYSLVAASPNTRQTPSKH